MSQKIFNRFILSKKTIKGNSYMHIITRRKFIKSSFITDFTLIETFWIEKPYIWPNKFYIGSVNLSISTKTNLLEINTNRKTKQSTMIHINLLFLNLTEINMKRNSSIIKSPLLCTLYCQSHLSTTDCHKSQTLQ